MVKLYNFLKQKGKKVKIVQNGMENPVKNANGGEEKHIKKKEIYFLTNCHNGNFRNI